MPAKRTPHAIKGQQDTPKRSTARRPVAFEGKHKGSGERQGSPPGLPTRPPWPT